MRKLAAQKLCPGASPRADPGGLNPAGRASSNIIRIEAGAESVLRKIIKLKQSEGGVNSEIAFLFRCCILSLNNVFERYCATPKEKF